MGQYHLDNLFLLEILYTRPVTFERSWPTVLGLGIISNSLEHSHCGTTNYSVQCPIQNQDWTRKSRFTSLYWQQVAKLSPNSPIPWQACENFCINRNICYLWILYLLMTESSLHFLHLYPSSHPLLGYLLIKGTRLC